MNGNSFIQIYFDSDLETKEEVYDFISEVACAQDSCQQKHGIIYQFNEREKAGSPLIAEHVLLPHIESEHVLESRILFFRLANPIRWDETIEDIRLIIAILLKKDEEEAMKKKIAAFTRSLADEGYVDRLLNLEEKKFQKEIIKFREES
ncbi:PTS sugar transporter subunit IIA [Halobacillus aidingensis]|uniref:PTS system, nitrogen regulatory IIA component n=1 Tax=Halobacillus aidingensis TaxID=240303 RepID=A0A1H0QQ00_HALAD|nr:PTS sugar transporter subunit IIA [Halobacillus aidingensis]SDP18776.1 PTS system, nitrogen regulatory IIA component [Halobacillus aidingensis]